MNKQSTFGVADLPNGIRLRMTRGSDSALERSLHDSSRSDLQLIDGDREFVQSIIDFQYQAKNAGHGESYPNAQYYMIEKAGDVIGRLVIDFGHNEVRIVDITLLPAWHGQGIGKTVLQAMLKISGSLRLPVVLTVLLNNRPALALYQQLGFQLDPDNRPGDTRLLLRWEPDAEAMPARLAVP